MTRGKFLADVRRIVAERSGYLCSRPNCPTPYTIGPVGESRRTCLGDAAHIFAASDGGPRAAPEMSDDELRSAENAIWLCARCHRLVDGDEARFTAKELQRWKRAAEARARARLEGGGVESGVRVPDLLSPRDDAWRIGIVSQIACGNLGVAEVEHAVRDAVSDVIPTLVPSVRRRVRVLLDEDGLLVEQPLDGRSSVLRVRGTQRGHLEASMSIPFVHAPGKGMELPAVIDRGLSVDVLIQAVSVLVRLYCSYGLVIAAGQNRNRLEGVKQLVLLDVIRVGVLVPSALLGGTGDAVGVSTVDQASTPFGTGLWDGPVGGLPALDQVVRGIRELLAFFRDQYQGLSPNPEPLRQFCQRYM